MAGGEITESRAGYGLDRAQNTTRAQINNTRNKVNPMKRILTLTLLALTLMSIASAEDRWVFVMNSVDNNLYYYDRVTYGYHDDKTQPGCNCYATVWIKIEKPDSGYVMTRWDIYRNRFTRTIETIEYGPDDRIKNTYTPARVEWSPITPGSMAEAVYDVFFPSPRRNDVPPRRGTTGAL
jgi:hypothetical protein